MRAEKRSEDEMRALVISVGGPLRADENRKSWLARVARQAGITVRAAKAAFYNEIADPEHKTFWKLREAARRERANKLARSAGVLDAAAVALASWGDAEGDRHRSAALVSAARVLRDLASEIGEDVGE